MVRKIDIKCAAGAVLFALSQSLQAVPVFTDDFSSGLGNWTASGTDWTTQTTSGKTYAINNLTDAVSAVLPPSMTHAFAAAPITTSWSAKLDYDWTYGGNAGNLSGNYAYTVSILMLSNDGDGYAVTVHQGTSNIEDNQNKLIEIYKVTDGIAASTALADGNGYNRLGWKTQNKGAPRFSPIELTWDHNTGLLSACYDNGTGLVLSTSIVDTSYSTFDKMSVVVGGWSKSAQPVIDNVTVSAESIPEAASLGLLGLGASMLLLRRR